MRRAVLEHLLRRRPFKPFRITVSSQDTFDVRHPEAAYLALAFMAIADPQANDLDAEMVWIDYRQIVYCRPITKKHELPL
jgi:hypothetical protein